MKTIILGDRESVLLFALEGTEGKVVENQNEAIEEIKRIKKARSYGLLIVTEEVAGWASESIMQLRFSKELPLVIDIPGSQGHIQSGKNLAEYIREAVGIRI
jgi:V/A-type H+/Na+-transporting ATPase subunit F